MQRFNIFLAAVAVCVSATAVRSQQEPNRNPVYQQLRSLGPGNEVVSVSNLVLKRDAATFTFSGGSFAFFPSVNGKITGAVFRGKGHIHLVPPTAEERHNLSILNKSENFDEDFDEAVLRFTDGTADELRKASTGKVEPDPAFVHAAQDWRTFQKEKLHRNYDLRILEDVLSPTHSGYFLIAMHGSKHAHLLFNIDPDGAPDVEPEEVSLSSWHDDAVNFLSAFRMQAGAPGSGGATDRIQHEDLDVTIERNGFLSGSATAKVIALRDGVAVIPIGLYHTLRVSKVEDEKGTALDFIQEKKDEDSDFAVIMAKPLKKGEVATMKIAYGGKDVVMNEGNGNYYPIARETWYPNTARGLGDYATYSMTFHVPKGLEMIATGNRTSESTEGKITTSTWKTDVALPVIGFNLGNFKSKQATIPETMGKSLTLDAYANTMPPDSYQEYQGGAIGNFSSSTALGTEMGQGQAAAQVYTNYFGSLPFTRVSLTQQYACNYGQSWPMLVYLPICGLFDQTQQHFLGLNPEDMYWKVVTAHEVAHQWWGQTVGFSSYRDQWMSEGFAQASAAIFLQSTRSGNEDFRDFWKQQRKLLIEKNAYGFRPIDVGPVTMGFRLAAPNTGWNIYQDLVYPKGAYILHMIRMMMWSPKDRDARFTEMMTDFATTYRLQPATTEDFKAMVEKHMTPTMDFDRDQRMDWFFKEFVYGTDLPVYHFESQVNPGGAGGTLHFKLTQSGVPDGFKSLVPIYLELSNGQVILVGRLHMIGSSSTEQNVALPKLPASIRKASINYYYDVLSIEN